MPEATTDLRSSPWPGTLPDPPEPQDRALELLLDPDRLGAVVGAPVRATRLRPKPGVSHVAALADRSSGRPVGWVQALMGEARAKATKTREILRELGLGDRLHERALPDGTLLLWGPLETDPRLARPLRAVTPGAGTTPEVLRYNPLRRLVLRVGDLVVRVTAEPHRQRWRHAVRVLGEHGVATLSPTPTERARAAGVVPGRRVSVWDWVEGRDLAVGAEAGPLRAAGQLLAAVHAVPLGPLRSAGRPDLARRGWREVRAAAEAAVVQLEQLGAATAQDAGAEGAPGLVALGEQARSVLAELPSVRAEGPEVLLHGDFSLDQCLATDDGRVVLGDLDRLCRGPAEVDLGSLWAVGLLQDQPVRIVQEGTAMPEPHPCWVAAALLARVSEPWRSQENGWRTEVLRCLELAARVLADGLAAPAPTTRDRLAPPTVGSVQGPAQQIDQLGEDRLSTVRGWRVPPTVGSGEDTVQVARAWPDKVAQGRPRVAVEGRDRRGRLRAGTIRRGEPARLLEPGRDPRLPALTELGQRGKLVVHRPGRRAVVALPDSYVKVLRPGRAPAVAAASRAGSALARAAGLAAADVLGHDDSVVELSVVPGRPVHQLAGDPDWARLWDVWAASWTAWQGIDADDLAAHTPDDEAQVLRTWRERATRAGVLSGTPWPDRLEQAAGAVVQTPAPDLVLTHRDLHDQQLLWDGSRLGVLDLDTLCRADPALDPANLLVHARLRRAQGLWPATAVPAVRDAAARVLAAAGVDPGRQRVAERATVSRLVAVYAFRPRWRDLVLRWAEDEWSELQAARAHDESSLMNLSCPSPASRGE